MPSFADYYRTSKQLQYRIALKQVRARVTRIADECCFEKACIPPGAADRGGAGPPGPPRLAKAPAPGLGGILPVRD